MNAPMDPKVAAIMAKLENKDQEEKKVESPPEKTKPPSTLEEFLAAEHISEWPHPITSEGPLDIQSEGLLLGSKDDIADLLREAAPLGLYMLEELEEKLKNLENKLLYYANKIVTEDQRPSRLQDRLFHSPSRTFMTEISESDAVKSHASSKGQKSMDFMETMNETRKKSIEYCQFPGFRHGELVELPGQLEAPPLLHRITNAQDFNPGFKKFWKKLFLSEASVAVMQDTFWWFFLEHFEKDNSAKENKDLLFDRIADSFAALFTNINTDVKDKFLSEYPDCLSQAIHVAYCEAFPESNNKFDDQFKQSIINLVYEWVTGIKPVPGTWKKWNLNKVVRKNTETDKNVSAQQMIQAAALNKQFDYKLDVDSFERMVDKLGMDNQTASAGTPGFTPVGPSREVTKATSSTVIQGSSGALQGPQGIRSLSQTKISGDSTTKVGQKESHQIGPGPEYERVKFNTKGRSPLISHYLHMRQLRSFQQPGKKVRRTEIAKMPEPGPTYDQLIQSTIAMSEAMNKEYQRICDETNQAIIDIEKKKRDTNREIDVLKKELLFVKNPLDLKILSERIMGLKERDRQTPLLDKQSPTAEDYDGSDEG